MLSENAQKKISIVVPVYNGEKYIKECLDSLIAQTYKNIEIILIDDGSTDHSNTICDEYKNIDQRVIALHIENGGVSKARNIGIENSTGEYLMFVDSDDWLQDDAVEILVDTINQNSDLDYINSSYFNIAIDGMRKLCSVTDRYIEIKKDGIAQFCQENYRLFSTPWAKLYRRNIIKKYNLAFDEQVKYGEDFIFNMKYLMNCRLISLLDTPIYNYRLVVAGSAQTKYFKDMAVYRIKAYNAILELIEMKDEQIALRFLATGLGHYGTYIQNENAFDGIKMLVDYFRSRVSYKKLVNELGFFKACLIKQNHSGLLFGAIYIKNKLRRKIL